MNPVPSRSEGGGSSGPRQGSSVGGDGARTGDVSPTIGPGSLDAAAGAGPGGEVAGGGTTSFEITSDDPTGSGDGISAVGDRGEGLVSGVGGPSAAFVGDGSVSASSFGNG